MIADLALSKRWILLGIICGFLADLVYAFMMTSPFSIRVTYPIAWSFGPLLVIAGFGIYHFLRLHRETIRQQLAVVFMALAGCCVTIMLTVQGVARLLFPTYKPDEANETAMAAWNLAYKAIMRTQGGVDLAWDIFIFGAIALFGSVMFARSMSWKILGIAGVIVGVGGLALNFATWPANPGVAGLVDAGPFAGLWFLALTIMMALNYRKVVTQAAA